MSRLDPSIPLSVKPFKGPDFARAYQEAQSLRDIAQQRQLRSVQMASAQGNLADEQTERERQAALISIAREHRIIAPDGTPTVDYPRLIDRLNQDGYFTEARQIQLDQVNAETLISARHKRQREEEAEAREDEIRALVNFKKDLQDVATRGNQQKYVILKPKAIKLGLYTPPELQEMPAFSTDGLPPIQPKPAGPPKMFRDPGGKEWVDSMIEQVDIRTMSDKERADARKSVTEAATAEEAASEKKLTDDEWVQKNMPEYAAQYGDFSKLPKVIRDAVRKKRIGVDIIEPEPKQWEVKDQVIYDAYAAKLKKVADKLTAKEKLDAESWYKGLTPERQSDQDKMVGYYKTNRPLFDALKGRSDEGPTVSNQISILNTLMNSSRRGGVGPIVPELYETNRKVYLPIWPDLPSYPNAKKIEEASKGKPLIEFTPPSLQVGTVIPGSDTEDGKDWVITGFDDNGNPVGEPVGP